MEHPLPPATAEPGLWRTIPRTGERLPAVGLGTWQAFDAGDGAAERRPLGEVLARMAATGSGVVDTSPMYGRAEAVVGDLARQLGLLPRLFVATKVWTSGRRAGEAQLEASRRRLGVERFDLLQVHNLLDLDTQLATLRAWQQAGRVRYVGVTHYTATAHDEVERVLRSEPLDFLQINYSPFEPEAAQRLLPLAADLGVAVLVNRPLGGQQQMGSLRARPLPAWAAELGCRSWGQLLLKWAIAHPAVTCAIPGTSRLAHLEDNLGAAQTPLPDEAQRRRIAAAVAG